VLIPLPALPAPIARPALPADILPLAHPVPIPPLVPPARILPPVLLVPTVLLLPALPVLPVLPVPTALLRALMVLLVPIVCVLCVRAGVVACALVDVGACWWTWSVWAAGECCVVFAITRFSPCTSFYAFVSFDLFLRCVQVRQVRTVLRQVVRTVALQVCVLLTA
jgi:hypothetical protein